MANIFISYADEQYKVSLDRIARQAKKVGIFDKVIKYTPKDLPAYIKASPLFAFSRGGGYWCWKPYIIYLTLQNCKEGDVVYYCDAGCTLVNDSPEWQQYQKQIETHTAIFFQYRDGVDYPWGVNSDNVSIKYWIKPSAVSFFKSFINTEFLGYGKIWAGFMIFKHTEQFSTILDQWYKITLFHPELVMDPVGEDLTEINSFYHTHDQAILTPLIYQYSQCENVLVLPETAESRTGQPAVLGSRWMQGRMSWWQSIKYRIWCLLHGE